VAQIIIFSLPLLGREGEGEKGRENGCVGAGGWESGDDDYFYLFLQKQQPGGTEGGGGGGQRVWGEGQA
jgi:hypothetical protein